LLYVITLAEVGGAQSYVRDLLPAVNGPFDVTVAAHGEGPLRTVAEEAGIRFIPLRHVRRKLSPGRDLLGLIELTRLFRTLRPDIVHLNSSKVGVLGRVAARLASVPVCVFTVHGWAFRASDGFAAHVYRMLDRATRPLATAIVCVSETERSVGLAAHTCTDRRTVVIPNAVSLPKAPALGTRVRPARVRLISVGRLAEQKDFATLVSALALVPRGSVELQILGEGRERSAIEEQIHRLGLDAVIELAGDVEDVPERLASADIFVLSSRYEGMPIAVLEAMAAGLPVVATDLGGLREMITAEGTQLLVPPGDPRALADSIARLVSDPALRDRLGSANRARVEDRFSLPRWREDHLALYDALLAASR
jgi:glycosyltransferase involved in cell wall biosynthesis